MSSVPIVPGMLSVRGRAVFVMRVISVLFVGYVRRHRALSMCQRSAAGGAEHRHVRQSGLQAENFRARTGPYLPATVIVAVSPLISIFVPNGFDASATRCRM